MLSGGQLHTEARPARAPADLDGGQVGPDARLRFAPVDLAARHVSRDTQDTTAGGNQLPARHPVLDLHGHHAGGNHIHAEDVLLAILADAVDDLERVRIATDNRIRSLISVKGEVASREVATMLSIAAGVGQLEHEAILELQRAVRAHSLGPWIKRTVGIGEKQGGRLLAAIGNPLRYVDGETGEVVERTVSKLWAYCGLHVVDGRRPRRARGERSNWSNTAKMRARLCAESCIKQSHSPYRAVYDRERAKWADRDTTDGHKHNHALAVVAKEILKDLWREARAMESN